MSVSSAEQYALQLLAKSASALPAGGGQSSSEPTDDFRIGDRVWIGGTKPGIIVYIGEVHFSSGDWAGVVLDTPTGKNNGTVNGRQYFQCEPNRGVFSRLNKLTRSPAVPPASGRTLPSESAAENQADDNKASSKSVVTTAGRTGLSEFKPVPSDKSSSPRGLRPVAAENHTAVFPTDTASNDNGVVPSVSIGDRVTVSGYKTGTLRYLGTTDFASGIWAGVELDEPVGKNDGCVAGTRYFNCSPMYGLFTPVHKLCSASDLHAANSPVFGQSAADARQKDAKRLLPSSRVGLERRDVSSPVPFQAKTKNGSAVALSAAIDSSDVLKLSSPVNKDSLEPGTFRRSESSVSVGDNDEIARRLKLFIEKLENDKIEMYHQLQEEKRKVEDLQFTLEESAIEKSDIEVQLEKKASQVKELEEKLRKETELTDRLSREVAASKLKASASEPSAADNTTVVGDQIEDYLDQIEELTHKLSIAESKLQASQSSVGSDVMNASEIASITAELEEERLERGRLSERLAHIKEDLRNMSHEKETAEKQRSEAVSQRDKLAVERSKLTVERDKAVAEKEKLSAEREKLAAEKEKVVKELSVVQKKLKEVEGKNKEFKDNMDKMEKTHLLQLAENRKLIEKMQLDFDSLLASHKLLMPCKQQMEQLAEKVKRLSNEREVLKEQITSLQSALQNHQQLEKLHASCESSKRDLQNRFSQVMKEWESEKNKLVSMVEMTNSTVRQKDKELEELRNQLKDNGTKAGANASQVTSKFTEQETKLLQQRVHQLEKALLESQMNANLDSRTGESFSSQLRADNEALKTQVDFLNSVIIEIQKKNMELESWKKQQLSQTADYSGNGHNMMASSHRLFCDICNVYDQHDTEDCPQQEM